MNLGASSPPLGVEERVPVGRERRRFKGFMREGFRRFLTPAVSPYKGRGR